MPPFSSVPANFAKALVLLAVLNPATAQAGADPFVVPTPIELTLSDRLKVVVETGAFEDVYPYIMLEMSPWVNDEHAALLVALKAGEQMELYDTPEVFGPYVPYERIMPEPYIWPMGNRIAQRAPGEPSPTPVGTPVDMVRYVRANAVSSYTGVIPVTSSVPWLRLAEVRDISVPGPLPLFGAATAFGLSRQLRRRISMGG
jgi:hypothetical protein